MVKSLLTPHGKMLRLDVPETQALLSQSVLKREYKRAFLHTPKNLLMLTFSLGVFFRALFRFSGFGG